jgi:hypothetical protein
MHMRSQYLISYKESTMRTFAVLLILVAIAASQPAHWLGAAVSALTQLFAR